MMMTKSTTAPFLLLLVAIHSLSLLRSTLSFQVNNLGCRSSCTSLKMGLFDGLQKAFSNEEFAAPPEGIKATARHILVKTKDEAENALDKLAAGDSFANLARDLSTCPSGAQGGSLGSFPPGRMVPAFDKVMFSPDTKIGEIIGPVETEFGYHLIVVDKRTGV